jgi:hypothetical protein
MNFPPPADPADKSDSRGQPLKEESTGLPGFPTWRRVYLVVLGSFVLWVVLLTLFSRMFA